MGGLIWVLVEVEGSPYEVVNIGEFWRQRSDGGTSGHGAFGGGGLVEHREASRSSYMARVIRMVAVNGEPFVDGEAAGDELAPGALADDLSLERCYAQRT
jgi:hypothetical protein